MCRTLHWKELTGINLRTFVRLFALLFPIAYCNPSNTKKFESRESQKCTISSTGSANFLFNELTPSDTHRLVATYRTSFCTVLSTPTMASNSEPYHFLVVNRA